MEKKEKAENVVFINTAKEDPNTVDNYSIIVDGEQFRAYPNPVFEVKDKETKELVARVQRTAPTEKKGLEKYNITVFDAEGETKFIAVQRYSSKTGKANDNWFNVSNPITYDEKTGKPQISWPDPPKEGETAEKNMMKLDVAKKGGGQFVGLTIQDQDLGVGFKVSDGSVYKVTPKGEPNELLKDAKFEITPTKDGKREVFKLTLGEGDPVAFIRKNGQGAYQRMTEKAKEAKEVEAEAAVEATAAEVEAEAPAAEAEAPKKGRGRFRK